MPNGMMFGDSRGIQELDLSQEQSPSVRVKINNISADLSHLTSPKESPMGFNNQSQLKPILDQPLNESHKNA